MYGENVVIVGKDECAAFREKVPKEERILGVAGLFNTGTHAVWIELTTGSFKN